MSESAYQVDIWDVAEHIAMKLNQVSHQWVSGEAIEVKPEFIATCDKKALTKTKVFVIPEQIEAETSRIRGVTPNQFILIVDVRRAFRPESIDDNKQVTQIAFKAMKFMSDEEQRVLEVNSLGVAGCFNLINATNVFIDKELIQHGVIASQVELTYQQMKT